MTTRGAKVRKWVCALPGDYRRSNPTTSWVRREWYLYRLGLLSADGRRRADREAEWQGIDHYLAEMDLVESTEPLRQRWIALYRFAPTPGTEEREEPDYEWRWG